MPTSRVARLVAEMGGLAEKQIGDAVDALSTHDITLAALTITLDDKIDHLQLGIEEKAILTIARRQPMGQLICGRSSARCGSRTISSALAISRRTSPSGYQLSTMRYS